MTLSKELEQIYRNVIKDLNLFYEKTKLYPLISLLFIIAVLLLIVLPHWQVSGINNVTEKVTQENQSRATLAQVLGGVAIGIGLYYTWRRINIAEEDLKITQENLKVAQDNLKITQDNFETAQKVAQDNLKVAQEGQITERFTRAVDQLGNEKMEIRLGGIYALERIANESEKDHWPIMEILTAYIRKNSSVDDQFRENSIATESLSMDIQANESIKSEVTEARKISLDIQAILTVIGRRNKSFFDREPSFLSLYRTYLVGANLGQSNLDRTNLSDANLTDAFLRLTNLNQAVLYRTNLTYARLRHTNLVNAILTEANLENAILEGANLECAYFQGANLKGANFERANLRGAENLTIDQLSKVKTLYDAELDEDFLIPLRKKYPALFEETKNKP